MTNRRTVRNRPNIFQFETGFKFHSRHARYDKLEINIDIATSNKPIEDIAADFRQIADRKEIFRFDGSDSYPALKIKANADALFGGLIKTYRKQSGNGYVIRAYLHLNPSRYFAHNPAERRISDSFEKIFRYERPEQECKRRSYDSNDNFIMDYRLAEANETNWNDLTRDYIHQILFYIQAELEDHSGNRGEYNFHDRIKHWTIKHLEYYWELKTAEGEARDIVHDFCTYLKERYARISETYHLNKIDRSYTSVSYIFDTNKQNQKIAIYAKAPDRIRIECRFSDNPKTMFQNISGEDYHPEYEDDLFTLMTDMRKKGVAVVNDLKKHHALYKLPERGIVAKVSDVLSAISYEAGSKRNTYFRKIIRSYMDSGKIIEIENHDGFNAFLVRLSKQGILEPLRKQRNKPRMYRIKAPIRLFLKD